MKRVALREVTNFTRGMRDYFSSKQKSQDPLNHINKSGFQCGNRMLVLTEGVGSASCPLPGEVCVILKGQLRKHFSGDRPSKPDLILNSWNNKWPDLGASKSAFEKHK